ncbi:phospholipase effector Tle1 domain-containing protein [Sinorhizobium prairiense]
MDERRAYSRTNLAATPEDRDVRQIWFAGAHCDVGGKLSEAWPQRKR